MVKTFQISHASFDNFSQNILKDLTWNVSSNENWVITGKSASGKTALIKALKGELHLNEGYVQCYLTKEMTENFKSMSKAAAFEFFQDESVDYNHYYYQQRYNSCEWEGTPTVLDYLSDKGINVNEQPVWNLIEKLNVENLLEQEYIKLSNGEHRKLMILKAMASFPKLLILDDPYIGLDEEARDTIDNMIDSIAATGTQIILASNEQKIPKCITHILQMENCSISVIQNRTKFTRTQEELLQFTPEFNFEPQIDQKYNVIFQLNDVSIKYNNKSILNNVNWKVNQGDKWALTGKNGVGKSMLISLLNADNPQSYANEIILFDKPRGMGESIWDIKERIGFLSPEYHFYFDKMTPCLEAMIGGLSDNPYKFSKATVYTNKFIEFLTEYYHITHLLSKKFHELSTGEQHLILFLRILIKNPVLLLLDEPFQGFDTQMRIKSRILLDVFCKNRTLVFVSHQKEDFPSCIKNFAKLINGVIQFSSVL